MKQDQSFRLSKQGKIASAVSMAIVLPLLSGTAVANTVNAVGSTSISKVGNVDVVNIANANANGLSHNQYTDFNVNDSGLVFNNSLESGTSQLAGQLNANSNLTDTAAVILNEVVSNNPSLLLGQQEVFGMAADYILANPNGITCDDCGFINTDRASLVVGTPTIDLDQLSGFTVGANQSNKLLIEGDIDSVKRLDLIAPIVDINGNITASDDINLISGRNDVDYDSLAVTEIANQSDTENEAEINVALDGSILGSMNAGNIRVHSSAANATQTLAGKFDASEAFEATADNLVVNDSEINANKVSLKGESNLYVGGVVQMDRDQTPETTEKVADRVKEIKSADIQNQSFQGSSIVASDIDLEGGNVAIEGSNVEGTTINATADNLEVSGLITTHEKTSKVRYTKGLWYNETSTVEKTQQFSDSSLTASDSLNLTSRGDLTVSGTSLAGGNVALDAENNLTATGLITENSTSNENSYKNETSKLKTGKKIISEGTQSEYLTSITGSDVSLKSGGDQSLEGVQLTADSVDFDSEQSISITSSHTTDHNTNDENFLYWGGIGGGETNIDNEQQTELTGSKVTAKTVSVTSKGDTNISASNIAASGDIEINTTGDLNINHDFAVDSDYFEDRHGSAFNITDEKDAKDHQKLTTRGSTLSGDKVTLAGDNITIIGSDVTAAGDLDVAAVNALTTDIANATDLTTTENFDISSVRSSKVTGDLFGCQTCIDEVNFEAFTFEASSGLKGVTTITTTGTGSGQGTTLTSANANLTGHVVDLNGTAVTGTTNVDITGNDVSTATGEALTLVDSKIVRSTGPEAYIRGGLTGIEIGIGLGHDQIINEYHEYKAVDSTIDSDQDVDMVATESLTNLGTQITADNVTLSAQDIVQDAGYDRIVDRDVVAGGDAALKLFANVSPIVGASVGLSGHGVGRVTENKTAIVTAIEADDTINITASQSAADAGTNIDAETINITADNYNSTSAYDSEVDTTHSGSGKLNVSAETSTFQDVTVAINGKGEYQYQQEGDATAVQGTVTANNVNIEAGDTANVGNNFETDTLTISAGQQAILAQNDDKQWNTTGGGFFGGSAGLSFSAASCGASPSFAAEGGFNFLDINNTQAVTTDVKSGSLNLSGGELAQVAGSNIDADTVIIKGNQANILAAQDYDTAVGANFEAKGSYSGSISGGGSLGVINESSNQATLTSLDAGNLTVTANGEGDALVIQGADITAGTAVLTNDNAEGSVAINAAQSNDTVGNFYMGANVGFAGGSKGKSSQGCGNCGGSSKMSYIPTGAGAQLIVESDNSTYNTLGSIKGGDITVNSSNDIALQSNVDVDTLTLNAGNDLIVNSAQDTVNKFETNQGVSVGLGSLKLKSGISSEDLVNTVNDGKAIDSLVDVNLSAKSEVFIDDQKVTQQATITADTLNTTVGSNNISVNAANLSSDNANLNGATVNTTDNDDYVHTIGFQADINDLNVSSSNLDHDIEEIKNTFHFDHSYDWSDVDGTNTKANIKL